MRRNNRTNTRTEVSSAERKPSTMNSASGSYGQMSAVFARALKRSQGPPRKHIQSPLCSKLEHNGINGMLNPNETVGRVYSSGGCELTAPGQECQHADPHISTHGRRWTSKRIIEVGLGEPSSAGPASYHGGIVLTANAAGYKSQPGLATQGNIWYTNAGYDYRYVNFTAPAAQWTMEMLNSHDQSLLAAPGPEDRELLYTICTGMQVRVLANTQASAFQGGTVTVAQSQAKSFHEMTSKQVIETYPKSSVVAASELDKADMVVFPTFLGIGAICGITDGSTQANFELSSDGGYLLLWFNLPVVAGLSSPPSIFIEVETGGWYVGDGVPAAEQGRLYPNKSCLMSCKAAIQEIGNPNEMVHFSEVNELERAAVHRASRTAVTMAPSWYDRLASGASPLWKRIKEELANELRQAAPLLL